MAMNDLFQALQLFDSGAKELATGRAIRSASEQAQQINMMEQDEFKKRQEFTNLGQGLAAQLSALGASSTQVQQMAQNYMPQQIQGPQDFFTQAAMAGSPKAQQQLQQAGQQVQAGLASAPLTTNQQAVLDLERRKQDIEAGLAAKSAVAKKAGENIQLESHLFDKWTNNQVTKDSQNVAVNYQKINQAAAAKSPASDMALIFSYMKMLDPGSTVREGEYATAEQAGPVAGRYLNLYNKALSGQKLTEAQRQDFLKSAKKSYSSQLMQQKKFDDTLRRRANDLGLDPERITLGETLFGEDYNMDKKAVRGAPQSLTPAAAQPSAMQPSAPASINVMDFIK